MSLLFSFFTPPKFRENTLKLRGVLRLQYFYNKSWMVSYYWFKFEFSTEITFLTQQ